MHIFAQLRQLAGLTLAGFAVWVGIGAAVAAEPYPSHPISLIVSFEPGGSTDISARAIAKGLGQVLGQPVVVENRPGAGGRIGTKLAAFAKPDGYTLLWGSGSSLTAAPALYADQQHVATLMPVSLGATQPFLFVIPASLPFRTTTAFLDWVRKNPGKVNFASAGTGSSNHLLGEILMSTTRTDMVHVPYRGAALAKDALIRGEAQLMDEVTSPLIGALQAGQLTPLFITSDKRDPMFPEVPTAAEVGLPDLTIEGFFGLLAPAGTPPAIIDRLNEAMAKVLSSDEVLKTFGVLGFKAAHSTPQQMADRIAEGKARYARIIDERHIHVD